jgi:hypothetical protein
MDQLFNHFSDIPALEKEKKQVLDIFQEIENGILDLSKLGFKIDAAKGVAELNAANKNLEKTTTVKRRAGEDDEVDSINCRIHNAICKSV